MTSERIKEIQQQTAYPDSISVQQALLQVWNECSQLPQQETFVSKGSDDVELPKQDVDKLGNEDVSKLGYDDHISDISKMVEDDVVKLAEEYAIKVYHAFEDATWFRPLNLGYYAGYTKAKETLYTDEQMNSFNERWAFSREQTRHISHRIGFGEGVRLGIAYSEEYYNQLEKTDKDEEDFESDYIDELYESLPKQKNINLYTEEQLMEVAKYTISEWASLNEQREHDHEKLVKTWLSIELQNFIQSLKQPKK